MFINLFENTFQKKFWISAWNIIETRRNKICVLTISSGTQIRQHKNEIIHLSCTSNQWLMESLISSNNPVNRISEDWKLKLGFVSKISFHWRELSETDNNREHQSSYIMMIEDNESVISILTTDYSYNHYYNCMDTKEAPVANFSWNFIRKTILIWGEETIWFQCDVAHIYRWHESVRNVVDKARAKIATSRPINSNLDRYKAK